MITEWGPNGHWEVQKTAWGAPIEQTSTEKKDSYRERYAEHISQHKKFCLGSYVFLWGQKQETTGTWYGLFTMDGQGTEVLDILEECWKGSLPKELAPTITSLDLDGRSKSDNIKLNSKGRFDCNIKVAHKDPESLKYSWSVIPESTTTGTGGDVEAAPEAMIGQVKRRKSSSATLVAPTETGAHRLFVVVSDRNNNVAYANIPFYVLPSSGDEFSTAVRLKTEKSNVMIGPSMPE